ncbi:MAG: hypothetical protein ACE37F_14445 [Nannocystaceae bacterium]|nr:hypothetical protein [bacterium]
MIGALALGFALAALPEGVELTWTGARGCPDAADVERRVAERLRGREGPVRASVVVAVVSGTGGGYALSLDVTLPGESVHRELEAAECGVLVDATAIVVGIAVEPQISAQALRTATLTPSVPEPAVVPDVAVERAPLERAATPEPEPEPVPEPVRRRVGGVVSLRGAGVLGVLPGVAGSAGLRVGVRGRRWRAELGGDRTFAVRHAFAGEPSVGAEFSMWSGAVRGCGVLGKNALEFPLCAGVDAGLMRADGFGGDINRSVVEPWAAAVVAPGLVWMPHPNVGLGVALDAFVGLARPSFSGEARPLLHRAFPVGLRLAGGLEVRFGPEPG